MIATQRAISLVQPSSYGGAWGGGGGSEGPRFPPPEASQYSPNPTAPPTWNHAHHNVYHPSMTDIHAAPVAPMQMEPMKPARQLKGKKQIQGSPSYFGKKKQSGHNEHPEIKTTALQWFPQTAQYYYGHPTPQRPIHMNYHLPPAESWLETYQQPENAGDAILGVRWSQRNNADNDMTQVGWVWKYFRLDGFAMQMWRNKEEELLGRDVNDARFDPGYRPILFWDLRRLRNVELQHRGGRLGPIINLYFPDGGVQFRAYSYNDGEMWRSACQRIIIDQATIDQGGKIYANQGQKLLEMMSHDNNTFSEENLSAMWNAYEKNHDGVLSTDEIKQLCKEMVKKEKERAMYEIENPRARKEKVQELMQQEKQIDERFAKDVQGRFDTDRDGRVTKTEFMNQAPKIFAGFGRSKSGWL